MYRFAFCLADKAAVQNADGAEQSIDTGLQANQAPDSLVIQIPPKISNLVKVWIICEENYSF